MEQKETLYGHLDIHHSMLFEYQLYQDILHKEQVFLLDIIGD